MDNYDEFWKRNVKVDTWLEIFFGPWTYFLWPIRHWHYYFFGHFGQLVKTKIKVIKVKEEKWLIKK